MARSVTQALREDVAEILLNALDDTRHKVIEQGWSEQEQTGNLQSPNGITGDDIGEWWKGSQSDEVQASEETPQDSGEWWRGQYDDGTQEPNQAYQPEDDGQAWAQEQ